MRWKELMGMGLLTMAWAPSAYAHGMEPAPILLALAALGGGLILGVFAGALGFRRTRIYTLTAMVVAFLFVFSYGATWAPNPIRRAFGTILFGGVPLVIAFGLGYSVVSGLKWLWTSRRQ